MELQAMSIPRAVNFDAEPLLSDFSNQSPQIPAYLTESQALASWDRSEFRSRLGSGTYWQVNISFNGNSDVES